MQSLNRQQRQPTPQPRSRPIPVMECSTTDFNLHGEIFAAVPWRSIVFRRPLRLPQARGSHPLLPALHKYLLSFPTLLRHPPPMAHLAPSPGLHRIRAGERPDSLPRFNHHVWASWDFVLALVPSFRRCRFSAANSPFPFPSALPPHQPSLFLWTAPAPGDPGRDLASARVPPSLRRHSSAARFSSLAPCCPVLVSFTNLTLRLFTAVISSFPSS